MSHVKINAKRRKNISLPSGVGLNLGPPTEKSISDNIRILSEVEKIWIRHDLNDDGELEY